jgi:hypothetical protein
MWVNIVWLLATLVGAVALIHGVVIPREEQYLERKFGAPVAVGRPTSGYAREICRAKSD